MSNPEPSKHQLPFSALLEQVCESPKRPDMREHAASFENEDFREICLPVPVNRLRLP
jgi:hypothetical protein